MRLVFRTDSGARIGSGHMVRCLTLANELRERGSDIVFVTREHDGHLAERVESAGHPVHRLPPPTAEGAARVGYAGWLGVTQTQDADETRAVVGRDGADWIVVDHYAIDAEWETALRPAARRIFAIDDLANRRHECDALLDQGYYGTATASRYDTRTPAQSRRLLGPRYALLHPEYERLHDAREPRGRDVQRVVVFFGGSDPTDETGKAIDALTRGVLAALDVDVVLGANHPDPAGVRARAASRPRTTVHTNLPTLAGLLARADLAIGAGGATTWERCCLGLPSIVAIQAENQAASTLAMVSGGYQRLAGNGRSPSVADWQEAIETLLRDPAALKTMRDNSAALTDGRGAKRVARALLGDAALDLTVRTARPSDEALLLEWANDPDVRAHSFNQDAIGAADHARWLARKLADRDTHLFIGEDAAGLPVGQVRFDVDRAAHEALIDISVDRCVRGAGVGDLLLSAALTAFRVAEPGIKPVAEVRDGNVPSQRLFTRLQFTPAPARRPGSSVFELVS